MDRVRVLNSQLLDKAEGDEPSLFISKVSRVVRVLERYEGDLVRLEEKLSTAKNSGGLMGLKVVELWEDEVDTLQNILQELKRGIE